MSGAASFVLGLLGLGASAGINAGQSIKQKRKPYIKLLKRWDMSAHQTCCGCESVFVKSGGICAVTIIMLVKNANWIMATLGKLRCVI